MQASGDGSAFLLIVVASIFASIIGGLIYFLPTIVAFTREHTNRWAILILNLLIGWTGVGWLVALIMALWREERNAQTNLYVSNYSGSVKKKQSAGIPEPEQQPSSQKGNDNQVAFISLGAIAFCALVFAGTVFLVNVFKPSHPIASSTVQEKREDSIFQPRQVSKPIAIEPNINTIPSFGTVKIFRQDSSVTSGQARCQTRLRPTIESFTLSNATFDARYSSQFIPCGQSVDVLSYDAPYYHVQTNINQQQKTGWIYAGVTTDWFLPDTLKPTICQLNEQTELLDTNGNLVPSLIGNRYVVLDSSMYADSVTLVDPQRKQLFAPRDYCTFN